MYSIFALALTLLGSVGIHVIPAAAVTPSSAEVDGVYFELSSDDTVRIIDRASKRSLETEAGNIPTTATHAQNQATLRELTTTIRDTLGWDLTQETDRVTMLNEIHALSRALWRIPDADFAREQYQPLRDLRDVVNAVEGTDCRGRCLPGGADVTTHIVTILINTAVLKMFKDWAGTASFGTNTAILAASMAVTALAMFYVRIMERIAGIPETLLRAQVVWATAFALMTSKQFLTMAQERAEPGTVARALQNAAKDVEDAAPNDPPNETPDDYDLIKQELAGLCVGVRGPLGVRGPWLLPGAENADESVTEHANEEPEESGVFPLIPR